MSGCPSARATAAAVAICGEHLVFDHKRRLEVSALSVWGLKKTRFENKSRFLQ